MRDLSLAVAPGEFFALLGPSGCGKTTTLRMIAGFEQPTHGQVLIRGVAMQGIPPFHRPVNTVFQDYALFPHMTVAQNVEFGLRMAGLARDETKNRAGDGGAGSRAIARREFAAAAPAQRRTTAAGGPGARPGQ